MRLPWYTSAHNRLLFLKRLSVAASKLLSAPYVHCKEFEEFDGRFQVLLTHESGSIRLHNATMVRTTALAIS
jgi:hypothetical protein